MLLVASFPRTKRTALTHLIALSAAAFLVVAQAHAQTEEEHKSHHPEQAASPAAGAMPAAAASPGMAGMGPPAGAGPPAKADGMMEGMGEMMKGMGMPRAKEMYPSLMALPELTPEKRQEVEQQAGERMHAGSMLMGQALDTLGQAASSGDYKAMQEAASRLREGVGQLESGVAARRALAEGRAPREIALSWFKREMNLASPADGEVQRGLFGVSVFHLFTMALLVAFALAMLAMYYFKMRRAAARFGRLDPDKGSPPPGSSPRLASGVPPPAGKGPASTPPEPAPSPKSS